MVMTGVKTIVPRAVKPEYVLRVFVLRPLSSVALTLMTILVWTILMLARGIEWLTGWLPEDTEALPADDQNHAKKLI